MHINGVVFNCRVYIEITQQIYQDSIIGYMIIASIKFEIVLNVTIFLKALNYVSDGV